jgi:type VI secretion system protein ImpG
VGYGGGSDQQQEFLPFYKAHRGHDGGNGRYYMVDRTRRKKVQEGDAGNGNADKPGTYTGSEVYISLTNGDAEPLEAGLKQLAIEALCTNRDLPLKITTGTGRSDFRMDQTLPCASIRCLGAVTPPRPSYAEGQMAWRLINHLTLNYLSLVDTNEREGAAALRDLLQLYVPMGDKESERQVAGVVSVVSRPIERRITTPQSIAFVRGLEITVTLEEKAFEGFGAFLLGTVLEQFFAKYVSINSFTETVVKTVERGEVMRWPMREGLRPAL